MPGRWYVTPSARAPAAARPALTVRTGGPEGIRTLDLFHAMEARSQLRHRPTDDCFGLYHRHSVAKLEMAYCFWSLRLERPIDAAYGKERNTTAVRYLDEDRVAAQRPAERAENAGVDVR